MVAILFAIGILGIAIAVLALKPHTPPRALTDRLANAVPNRPLGRGPLVAVATLVIVIGLSATVVQRVGSSRGTGTAVTTPAATSDPPTATPTASSAPEPYTVVSGDTLSSIASRFHVSAVALAQANSISDPTKLAVGQVLAIPASP